jgi:hypothetical protein
MMMRMIVPMPMYTRSPLSSGTCRGYPAPTARMRPGQGRQCSATWPSSGSSGRPSASHAVSPPASE